MKNAVRMQACGYQLLKWLEKALKDGFIQRLKGIAVGAASLALWRSFAWTPKGSPKKDFVLTTNAIMMAQDLLAERLSRSQTARS